MKMRANKWRTDLCRQVSKNGKKLPFALMSWTDETALKYFAAYHPAEYEQIIGIK